MIRVDQTDIWIKPVSGQHWARHELSKAQFGPLTENDLEELNVSEEYSGSDFSAAEIQGRDWRVLIFKYDTFEADFSLYAKNCAVRVAHQRGSDT